jgi:hypothetical protein
MRWYDYLVCFLIADLITGMLFASSILVFIPYLIFELYCEYRKEKETKS